MCVVHEFCLPHTRVDSWESRRNRRREMAEARDRSREPVCGGCSARQINVAKTPNVTNKNTQCN